MDSREFVVSSICIYLSFSVSLSRGCFRVFMEAERDIFKSFVYKGVSGSVTKLFIFPPVVRKPGFTGSNKESDATSQSKVWTSGNGKLA